jgi:hypothetical protein
MGAFVKSLAMSPFAPSRFSIQPPSLGFSKASSSFSVRYGKNDPDDDRGAHGDHGVSRYLNQLELVVCRHSPNMRPESALFQPGTLPQSN